MLRLEDEGDEGEGFEEEADVGRFRSGRDGDHLLTPFQCDTCWFRNLKGRDPTGLTKDRLVLVHIRRANLDAFWAREPTTVVDNWREGRRFARIMEELGLEEVLSQVPRARSLRGTTGEWPLPSQSWRDPGTRE